MSIVAILLSIACFVDPPVSSLSLSLCCLLYSVSRPVCAQISGGLPIQPNALSLKTKSIRFSPRPDAGGNPFTTLLFDVGRNDGTVSGHNTTILINIKCVAGYHLDQASSSCRPCSPGFFKDRPSYSTSCDPCPRHYYVDVSQATRCLPCANGTFQDEMGQSTCKECKDFGYPAPCVPTQVSSDWGKTGR